MNFEHDDDCTCSECREKKRRVRSFMQIVVAPIMGMGAGFLLWQYVDGWAVVAILLLLWANNLSQLRD